MEQETTRAAAPAGPAEPRDETVAEDDGVGVAEHHGIGSRRLFSLTSQLRRQRPPSQTQAWVRSQAEAAKAGNDTFRSGSDDAPAGPSDGTNGNGTSAAAEAPAEEAQVAGAPSGGTGARRATAPAAAAPRRPARPIYTLQQVHEMTGIPYPKLAFYAASEGSRIPSLGERHAPAYPFESLQAFCRLHAERTPGWEIPDLTPPDDEISLRLEALERGQRQLEVVLQVVLAELAEPLTGTSH